MPDALTCVAPPGWEPRAVCPVVAAPSASTFRVLTWNLQLLPPWIPGQPPSAVRARLIAERLEQGFDALVFQETFDLAARRELLDGLAARGYPHATVLINPSRVRVHSGLTVASRWPIEDQASLCYRRAIGVERFANKGAVHVALRTAAGRVHLFATHTQSDAVPSPRSVAVRASQFRELRAFIDARVPSRDEPVLIAGDLNVDWHDAREFGAMLETLDGWWPLDPWREACARRFTFDPANQLVNRSGGRWFDYVLASRRHARPREGRACLHAYRAPWRWGRTAREDLADHYAVAVGYDFSGS